MNKFETTGSEYLRSVRHTPGLDVTIVSSEKELHQIGSLRHRNYLLAGLIDANASGVFIDEYDRSPGTRCYAIWQGSSLVASVRTHVLTSTHCFSPTFTSFGELIEPAIASGVTVLDVSRLVVDQAVKRQKLRIIRKTLSVAYHSIATFGAHYGVAAVQPKHLGLYRTYGGFRQFSEPRSYAGVKRPFVLIAVNARPAVRKNALTGRTGFRFESGAGLVDQVHIASNI